MAGGPYTLLSCAVSIDGCLDDGSADRLILSGPEDLDEVDELRAAADAILVGAGTVRADNPRLLVRDPGRVARREAAGLAPHPLRVTITASGELDPAARFFTGPGTPLVYCATPVAMAVRARLGRLAVVIDAGDPPSLRGVFHDLHSERNVATLLVEGGSRILRDALADDLADELRLAVAPYFVGDPGAPRFGLPAAYPHTAAAPAALAAVRRLGDVAVLHYSLGARERPAALRPFVRLLPFLLSADRKAAALGVADVSMHCGAFCCQDGESQTFAEREANQSRGRGFVVDVDAVLESAGLKNDKVREYVRYWAGITGPEDIQVVSAADDARLIQECLDAQEILPAGEGVYYARSYYKDTARSEERTIVATNNPADKGVYNNWRPAAEMKAKLTGLMRGASAGKTMYVIPYLMAAPGSPLEKYAAGVQLTDNRSVVLHMIRMARVSAEYINDLADPGSFVRAVHVTGDLENLGQGTPEDKRYFVTVADERTILHFGSSYGGNALLGKIAHGLRQSSYDGWTSGLFLGEQFMLLGIVDKQTGKRYHICGGFPSASGKTNLAMMLPPDALGDRYHVEFYGDDIAWLWVGEDGRLYGMNPEFGVFGVARDTNETTNPTALESVAPGTHAIFTNVAYNEKTHEVWWEGRTKNPPADLDGWLDWKGNRIADRSPAEADDPWAHPNSRFTTTLSNVPNVASDYADPRGVPIDAIIFGGRTRDREPLIRAITDVAEGVYDGLTLGAEATFAAEGVDGQLRYDPMSMRPFMSYPEGPYAAHWLHIVSQATQRPLFAHVNWFQRDPEDGHFLWPGYRENLRALLWLMQLKDGEVEGVKSPVGILPAKDELNLDGLDIDPGDLDKLLTIDTARWQQEMGFREQHLAQFPGLPEEIWEAHRRVAAALNDD